MTVLVCGGAGFIGSHVNKLLSQCGYETVILDNLIYGHREAVKWGKLIQGDLSNIDEIEIIFKNYNIEAVLHFAAFAYVGESVREPEKYYYNNVVNTLNLLQVMRRYGCRRIVFSSSCATYGDPESIPITEKSPQNPINPYGFTKLVVEQILRDYQKAFGIEYVVLRYFNAAGADPDGEIGESHNPETHIIPIVLDAAVGNLPCVKVFGTNYPTPDGSCIRDYIHVCDLASAHLLALRHLEKGYKSECFNLGNSEGVSVFEIISAVKRITCTDFDVVKDSRREGDPAILIASCDKARNILGWTPRYTDINTIVDHAWSWRKNVGY